MVSAGSSPVMISSPTGYERMWQPPRSDVEYERLMPNVPRGS